VAVTHRKKQIVIKANCNVLTIRAHQAAQSPAGRPPVSTPRWLQRCAHRPEFQTE
jgi:hypothetical protein